MKPRRPCAVGAQNLQLRYIAGQELRTAVADRALLHREAHPGGRRAGRGGSAPYRCVDAGARSAPVTIAAMLDHEEKFLFKEEILHLANALNDPGSLDNVEDLLTDVITSPRFDSEVFTLERSLQVMLGARAGTTLVGLLTVAPEVFDEVAEVRIPAEVHERLVAWRARFGLAIDNALNFLNNPDGIQGHNFATQIAHVEERRVLQGRLTLVRYNNEPQFFVADAAVFLGLVDRHHGAPRPVPRAGRRRRGVADAPPRGRPAHRAQDRHPRLAAPDGAPGLPRRDRAEPRQDHGALGLVDGFRRRGLHTGFIKPVGQRTVIDDGQPADEDAVLMKSLFDLPEPYSVMSPVHIPRGFTKAYIAGKVVEDLGARIQAAHREFADHDLLLIEGTGHAGVGAVIGLSNAVVAAMLGAPAVIVSEGGVGRPIDEIVLNASRFQAYGVRVAGAIVNKVEVDEQPGIEDTLGAGLAKHGIPLLGVLPYRPILSNPTLGMIVEGVRGECSSEGSDLDRVIGDVAIGAMEPRPHARARRPDDAGHRAGRPRGRDPHAHERARGDERPRAVRRGPCRRDAGRGRGRPRRAGARARPHRRLRAAPEVMEAIRGRGCSRCSSRTTRTPSRPRSTTCS